MPTSRELVTAIREREGVNAAIVLGRDGLLIDGQHDGSVDPEHLAAHVPSILAAADELAGAARQDSIRTIIVEYAAGLALISVLSVDAMLLLLVRPDANLAQLLFEVRRNRERIAALV